MANNLVAFVENAYTNNESRWFCDDYQNEIMHLISLEEKQEAFGERREKDSSDSNHNFVLKEISLTILVKVNGLKKDTTIMASYGVTVQNVEMIAYTNLGDSMQRGNPLKNKYWKKAMAIRKETSTLPSDTPEAHLCDLVVSQYLSGSTTTTPEEWEQLKSAYEMNIIKGRDKHGDNDLRAMKFESELASNMSSGYPEELLEAETMIVNLCKRAKLVLGAGHTLTREAEAEREIIQTRVLAMITVG